jgi:hypothetical protein
LEELLSQEDRAMLRTHLFVAFGWAAGLTIAVGAIVVRPARADEPSPDSSVPADATATDQAPAAALEVQRALGGPLANQFPQLQAAPDGTPWWKQFRGSRDAGTPFPTTTAGSPWPTWWTPARPRDVVTAAAETPAYAPPAVPQISALRRTAAELEMTANRLEEIELYRQADALRELAQRLRTDARESLTRIRGKQQPADAGSYGLDVPGHTGEQTAGAEFHPYPSTGAEYGGSVSHDSAAAHEHAYEHDEAGMQGQPQDERSVIVGPAPE